MKVAILAVAVALVAGGAGAATIYDSGDGTILWTTIGIQGDAAAAAFTFGSSVTINSLEGFIQSASPGQDFTVDVWADNGHVGALIFSENVTSTAALSWQGATDMDLTLAPGSYWIGFDTPASSTMTSFLWGKSPNPDPVDEFIVRQGFGGPWVNTRGADYAIRIGGTGGTPISDGVPFSGGGDSGVPEPSSWALMIAGFGLAGVAIRRRSSKSSQGSRGDHGVTTIRAS